MKNEKICIMFLLLMIFTIFSCSMDSAFYTEDSESCTIVWVPGNYKMIEVPVPQEGITFPIGFDDDNTATIDDVYYLGETQVTFGLWQAVASWATFEKKGERYDQILWKKHPYLTNNQQNYPICGITYLQVLVWCNAYTEWHNQKYGTDYTVVYTDESGKPIRDAKEPYDPSSYSFSELEKYLANHFMIKEYILNIDTSGTGFRLPTPHEWELAARWHGTDDTNSVKEIINGVDFAKKSIKFTKGNSASGASDSISNLNECHKYAVFEYNSKGNLSLPKTKMPNTLGIYDMSGNLREFVYHVLYINLRGYPYPFAQTRGGYFEDTYGSISIGGSIYVDIAAYNYYYGLRVARNK